MKVSKTGYKKNSKDKNEPALVIPSNKITMRDVEFPVFGISNTGDAKMMYPGLDYSFGGNYVYELPMIEEGYAVPGRYRNPEGNWVSVYAYGGDISIPDLSRPNWLEKYQDGSQVKANLPGYNPEIGPTVKNAQLLQELKMQEAVRNSRQLPSGTIQSTLGPIEYAVFPALAAPAVKAAMTPKAPVDSELEAIRKILRKNVTHPKQTGPLTETPPWPNRFLDLGDDAWVIGNMERGRTSVANPDIDLPGRLPKPTPKRLPGVNGTLYPDRLPKQNNGGVKSSGEGYYDYINGYSGIFAKGGSKGWLDNYK